MRSRAEPARAAPTSESKAAAPESKAPAPEARAPEAPAAETKAAETKATEAIAPAAAPSEDLSAVATAERYLRAGGAGGDLAAARALVDPACSGEKVWDVDADVVLGARMTLTAVKVEPLTQGETEATVRATVTGTAKAEHTTTETEVLGKKVKLDIAGVQLGETTLSTQLTLLRRDGRWLIGCRQP
ncbi:MAG: hypothetical protein U1F43_34840 [Myxococcota bacterium]